jgi:hypothetical protein
VKDQHIKMIIKELCQNMMAKQKGAEQLRDVSIMGMVARVHFIVPA